MAFLLQLYRIWQVVSPFLTEENFAKISALFTKVMADYRGGDYRQLILDLVQGLAELLPSGAHPGLVHAAAIMPEEVSNPSLAQAAAASFSVSA